MCTFKLAARAARVVWLGLGCVAMSALLSACGEGPSKPDVPTSAASTHDVPVPVPLDGDEGAFMVGGYPAEQFLLERDRFLPATDPRVVSAKDVPWLLDDDEVFGVFRGAHARAYPVTMISYHHVVNDTLDGIPILVTY